MRRLRRSSASALMAQYSNASQRERDERDDNQGVGDRRPKGVADCGVCSPMTFSVHQHRERPPRTSAGMMAKYLATSFAMRERGQRAARHQQLLADLDDLEQLGRVRNRGRPCCPLPSPPACRCSWRRRRRPARAPARRWCRRRSSRRSLPSLCSRLISAILSSGVGFGQEVVDARFVRDRGRGQRVVAGDHHGLDPHRPQLRERARGCRL